MALDAWAAVVGPDVAGHSRPLEARGGVLRVAVRSGVWAAQISFLRSDILQRLNAATGARLHDLRFLVDSGALDAPAPPGRGESRAPEAEPCPSADDRHLTAVLAQTASLVQDEDVRRAWEGMVRAAHRLQGRRNGAAAGQEGPVAPAG